VAVIDWHSRRVLAWRLSNTMDTAFCVEALAEAIQRYGTRRSSIPIKAASLPARRSRHVEGAPNPYQHGRQGRALDNIFVERLWRSVKYEEVYPRQYQSLREAHAGLAAYFRFYNTERPHQSLANRTPADVYDNSQPLQRAA
jgi:putative transposase